MFMNLKLPLNEHIYTLIVGRLLTTNVFQINLGQLLFKATLRVRLCSHLSLLSKWTTLAALKSMDVSKNSQLVYGKGSFTSGSIHC